MAWYSGITSFASKLFVGDKGIIEQISATADKWHPSKTTVHKMSIEDQQAGDSSQESARNMLVVSHDSWIDIGVDAISRLPRPAFAIWAFGVLVGFWEAPSNLSDIHPLALNIIWTVVTFYFGARVIIKDIPSAIALYKNAKK
jgi:hypothetical protein